MPRSVNSVAKRARRKKVLKQAKGYFGRRKNVWTVAKNAVEKAMQYAYRDRRAKKRTFRALYVMLAKPGSIIKKIVDKILPSAGEGPSKKDRENGYFNLRFYVTYKDGSNSIAKVTGDMDPGYG